MRSFPNRWRLHILPCFFQFSEAAATAAQLAASKASAAAASAQAGAYQSIIVIKFIIAGKYF
jgi:hypothetical protein